MVVSLMTMGSCKKDDDSKYQPKGNYGNTFISTQTISIDTTDWYHVGTSMEPGDGFEAEMACSIITSSIVNSGAVMAYLSADGTVWTALPYTFPSGTSSSYLYSESWNYAYEVNKIFIDIQDNDFQTYPPAITVLVKVVAISSEARLLNPNMAWTNYNEVKKTFNLAD